MGFERIFQKFSLLGLAAQSCVMVACLALLSQSALAYEDGLQAIEITDSPAATSPSTTSSPQAAPTVQSRTTASEPVYKPNVLGRKAAEKYMAPREPASATKTMSSDSHYLAIHVGSYVSDDSYTWGNAHEANVGRLNMGLTYRIGEWKNSGDYNIRIDFSSYTLAAGSASKLAFMPTIIFPDANSRFPLYFGAGAGPGIYLKQLNGQSTISIDYSLFLGARFFDVYQNTGFFVEGGLRNHFHLLSSGQFNGSYAAVGAVFTF